MINLEINKSETIEDCFKTSFNERWINDYKYENKLTKAKHTQIIDKLPKVLIVHLKRFYYKERLLKNTQFIEFPGVLTLEDNILSGHLK